MVHDCLFIYIATGHHIWRSFPYPPPGDAAGSLQQGPKLEKELKLKTNMLKSIRKQSWESVESRKQSWESVESVLKQKRKATMEGFAEKEGFKPG